MKKIILGFVIASGIAVVSCKKDTATVEPTVIGQCDTVTYDKHIKAIVTKSCLGGCHDGSQSPTLTSYALVKSQIDNGKLKKTVITDQSMPQGSSLTANELGLIQCWIDNGGKQN